MLNLLAAVSVMGMIGFAALPSLILSQKQAKMSRIAKINPRLKTVSTAKVIKRNGRISGNDGIRTAQVITGGTALKMVLAVHGKRAKYGPPQKEMPALRTHQTDSLYLRPANLVLNYR